MQTMPTAFDALLVILGNILMAIMLQSLYIYLYSSFFVSPIHSLCSLWGILKKHIADKTV